MWDSRAEADRWLKQAANDLDFARVGLREGFHAQACFLAQQSAEKAVKAIGYSLGDRTVLGHSVAVLVDQYAQQAPDLAQVRADAGVLDQYYIPTRYPNGLPGGYPFKAFTQGQASAAITAAERFLRVASDQVAAD